MKMKLFQTVNTKKIPATIAIAPTAVFNVTCSLRIAMLVNVEKSGVVEEMGTACDCGICKKL